MRQLYQTLEVADSELQNYLGELEEAIDSIKQSGLETQQGLEARLRDVEGQFEDSHTMCQSLMGKVKALKDEARNMTEASAAALASEKSRVINELGEAESANQLVNEQLKYLEIELKSAADGNMAAEGRIQTLESTLEEKMRDFQDLQKVLYKSESLPIPNSEKKPN
jgi:chromosome segregation ATPase